MAHRQLVALFLSSLIALQSWAAVAVPCNMPMDNENVVADVMDHHAGHGMTTAVEDTASADHPDMQCCEQGYCSQSGCVAMTFIASSAGMANAPQYNVATPNPGADLPDWSPGSLFRPPSL